MVAANDTNERDDELARLRAELAAVRAERDAWKAQFEALRAEVERLKARLGQNSTNSHRPPSADPPGTTRPTKKKGGRKRGGQPGHKGQAREMLPAEAVHHFVPCKPLCCAGCGAGLVGDDPSPQRHQITEVPKIAPTVIEYQVHALSCHCGRVTHGKLPEGVGYGAFGPRLQALVAMLSGVYRLSKRNIEQLMADCFGVKMSVGSISNLERATSRALQAPVTEARDLIPEQRVAHADETGWRQAGKKAWLWVAVTGLAIVFLVRMSRGAKVAKELLGESADHIVVSDRWSGYNWVGIGQRQLCWSHLIRDFQKLADSRGPAADIGKSLGEHADELFVWWHKIREATCTRAELQAHVAESIRPQIQRLLTQGAALPAGSDRQGMFKALLAAEPAMWTFVSTEGVEPTNNTAERAVRHGVMWRRTSFGTQSNGGSLFVERILTTIATLRLHRRHVLDYLTAACRASRHRTLAPSFIHAA